MHVYIYTVITLQLMCSLQQIYTCFKYKLKLYLHLWKKKWKSLVLNIVICINTVWTFYIHSSIHLFIRIIKVCMCECVCELSMPMMILDWFDSIYLYFTTLFFFFFHLKFVPSISPSSTDTNRFMSKESKLEKWE